MPSYVTPGVYYEFVDLAPPGIGAVRLDITAFLGLAERGSVQQPVPVTSWQQFQSGFGNFLPQAYLGYTVKAFFENGGDRCYIVRVAAPPRETTTDPAAVQPADRLSSIVKSVEGFAAGAVVTLEQGSLRADHLLAEVDAPGRKLKWEEPLEPGFVLASPIHFATGAWPANAVLLDGAGAPALAAEAASPGSWGNQVEVHVSHASLAATVTATVPQPPARTSSLVASVTGFPIGTVVKVFQDQVPSALKAYRKVVSVDPVLRMLGWDTALPAAFDITKPISFESLEFSLTVLEQRRIVETYPGLSLEPEHPRYAPGVVNLETPPELKSKIPPPPCLANKMSSPRIKLERKASASAWPDKLPAIATARLGSGRDGTAAITVRDYTGDPGSDQRWGVRLLEDVDEIGLLAAPDLMVQPQPAQRFDPPPPVKLNPCLPHGVVLPSAAPLPPRLIESVPGFSLDQIAMVQQQMALHCQDQRYRFALLDPPFFSGPAQIDISEIQSWRGRFDTRFAALYYPWVLVYDPLQSGGRTVRAIPPSGHVAGVIAQTDLSVGVHKAPANVELAWAQDVTTEVDSDLQGLLNPLNINCIRLLPGRGLRIYGARTLSSDTQWQFVNVRRLLLLIEKSVEISTQWSVFEPNDYTLRQSLVLAISSFLESLWKKGALSGGSPDQSFFVKCDEENNPPDLADQGQLLVEVGVAPTYPAEFVIFRIGRTKDTLEITE
jgi:uncharacterized protein